MENKKKFIFIYIIELLAPILLILLFNLIYCIFENNYYYLPSSLDFIVDLFFNLTYIIAIFYLFFSFGLFYYSIINTKIKPIILSSALLILSSTIPPLLLALSKLTFFNNVSSNVSSDYLKTLIENDYFLIIENIIKVVIGIVLAILVRILFKNILKKELIFKKPYFLPNGIYQIVILVYLLIFFIPAVVLFIKDTNHNILSFIIEILYFVFGYFSCILGSFIGKKTYI